MLRGNFDFESCPACMERGITGLFRSNSLSIWRCPRCSLIFQNPQPSDEALKKIYNDSYALENSFAGSYARFASMKEMTARRYLSYFNKISIDRGKKLLEVGCGSGFFLAEAMKAGFDAYGLEISRHAADAARSKIGPDRVFTGSLENAPFADESFDLCVLIDVIEHIREPSKALKKIHDLLKPCGALFLVVPSTDSLSYKIMGKFWMEFKEEHLFYFGGKSIRLVLKKSGFSRIRTRPSGKLVSLEYILCHFERFSSPVISRYLSGIRSAIPRNILERNLFLPSAGMWVSCSKLN